MLGQRLKPSPNVDLRSVLARCFSFFLAALVSFYAGAAHAQVSSAALLRAKFAEILPRLEHNSFGRPLYLESTETSEQLYGEIYAEVNYPFTVVKLALDDPTHWCELLILHINTKYCRPVEVGPDASRLAVNVGRKNFEELNQTYRLDLVYRMAAATHEYFDATLRAASGPMGTSDYRIELEGVSVGGNKTFLHLSYSYSYGAMGRIAMQAYLATIGRGKVGFSQTGLHPDGPPIYIDGVRGVVERNTMRYYLAIDAYLLGIAAPPADRMEKRLLAWHSSTEKFSRQLHDVDLPTYLDMKRREVQRQIETTPQ
jgi:hypothetical protein